jgi:hypothetical protein
MRRFTSVTLGAGTMLLAACSSSSTGASPDAAVRFNVATVAKPAASARVALSVAGKPDRLTDGTNTLVVDTAQMVLRDIKFHMVETAVCSDSSESADTTGHHGGGDNVQMSHDQDGNDNDCDELRIGPYLLDMPLDAGPARSFTIDLPAGTYREVKYKVHKANMTDDATFLATHPEFDQRSVRVVGTYNGIPYVFTSDVSAEQEAGFNPPLAVDGTTATDLTLFVDLSSWFLVNGALVDPALANDQEPLASQVKNNIKASIRAFEDDNQDGEDDHNEQGGSNHGSD